MLKFPKVLGFLGIKSNTDPVTEAHLQAAEDKISQLEQEKTTAESTLATTQASLRTAEEAKTKVEGDLSKEKEKTATLEDWKKNQQATDGREQDESNTLDGGKEALAPWEQAAASAIASTKKRLGEK